MNKQLFYVRVVQLIFILFLSFTIPVFGQTKVLEQVDTNLYEYRASTKMVLYSKKECTSNQKMGNIYLILIGVMM